MQTHQFFDSMNDFLVLDTGMFTMGPLRPAHPSITTGVET